MTLTFSDSEHQILVDSGVSVVKSRFQVRKIEYIVFSTVIITLCAFTQKSIFFRSFFDTIHMQNSLHNCFSQFSWFLFEIVMCFRQWNLTFLLFESFVNFDAILNQILKASVKKPQIPKFHRSILVIKVKIAIELFGNHL